MNNAHIALIEPFYTGSHKKWAEEFKNNSQHNINIYSLSGRFWKWRMHGAAISIASKVLTSNKEFDIFLVSDFLNLSIFKSLVVEKYPKAKFYIYFHENQLTYPWSSEDQDVKLNRDQNYSFINYSSALVADKIFFNSNFHRGVFLESLKPFLKQFPDEQNLWSIDVIKKKSNVLSLALELPKMESNLEKVQGAILWNHRWEYDKNPEEFFKTLVKIKERNIDFKLIVLGEKTNKYPEIFNWAKEFFKDEIIHFGYVSSKKKYWELLQKSVILPVTSKQDFFGISIVEAIHANVYPLLPNRLVYPEHLPEEEKDKHLFNSDFELEEKLISLLTKPYIKKDFSKWVKKYSWKDSIDNYDKLMSLV